MTRPEPLHQRIRADIEARIRTGEWKPGHRIPFEHELTAAYGCSRMTVNKAISALTAEGLIVRRRRAGSFVARPRLHAMVLDIPDIAAEIAGRGEAYGYRLLSRREQAGEPGFADGPLLALECLHLAGERPFAVEARLISLATAPEAREVDFERTSPGSWLLGHIPWTEAEHRIMALAADGPTAALLSLDKGSACLALERRTWRVGEPVTFARQVFPGDAYDLVARFAPSPKASAAR